MKMNFHGEYVVNDQLKAGYYPDEDAVIITQTITVYVANSIMVKPSDIPMLMEALQASYKESQE